MNGVFVKVKCSNYTTQTTINAFQMVCLTSNITGGVFTLYGLKSS